MQQKGGQLFGIVQLTVQQKPGNGNVGALNTATSGSINTLLNKKKFKINRQSHARAIYFGRVEFAKRNQTWYTKTIGNGHQSNAVVRFDRSVLRKETGYMTNCVSLRAYHCVEIGEQINKGDRIAIAHFRYNATTPLFDFSIGKATVTSKRTCDWVGILLLCGFVRTTVEQTLAIAHAKLRDVPPPPRHRRQRPRRQSASC